MDPYTNNPEYGELPFGQQPLGQPQYGQQQLEQSQYGQPPMSGTPVSGAQAAQAAPAAPAASEMNVNTKQFESNDFLINLILNSEFSSLIIMIIFVLIFYLIFEHIYDLTKLILKYESNFDYGKHLKTMCEKEYFEYETERFQANRSIEDVKLQNNLNRGKYLKFILIVTIIVSLFVSILFAYLIYNSFYNTGFISMLLNKTGADTEDFIEKNLEKLNQNTLKIQSEDMSGRLKYIFQLLVRNSIKIIYFAWSPMRIIRIVVSNYLGADNKLGSAFYIIIMALIFVLIYFIIAIAIVLMPLYIGLKLSGKADISPFTQNYNAYIPYIILFCIISIMKLGYYVYGKEEYNDFEKNKIFYYFSNNVNNMYIKNNLPGYIAFFSLIVIYLMMFYILGNVINLYNDHQMDILKEDDAENTSNVTNKFLNKILGFNEYNNYQIPFIQVKNISGIFFTICIIILVMTLIYIYMKHRNESHGMTLIKYGIILPLFLLGMVIYLTNASMEFNTYVNKNIISNPTSLYKQYIFMINKTFNPLIDEEHDDKKNTRSGYVCKNVGNAILLALYSKMFKGVQNQKRSGDDTDDQYVDITPEFEYDNLCDTVKSFEFNKNPEYSLSYYLNGKVFNKNIFYKFNQCSLLNTDVVRELTKNFSLFSNEEEQNLMDLIDRKLYQQNNLQIQNKVAYIQTEIIKDDLNIKVKNYRNKLIEEIKISINNIDKGHVFNDITKKLIYFDQFTESYSQKGKSILEVNNHNNNIKHISQDSRIKVSISLDNADEYDGIVYKIADEWMNCMYYNLYAFTPLYKKYQDNMKPDNINYKEYIEKLTDLQEEYVKNMVKTMNATFDRINDIMTMPISSQNDNYLTKYIITNYNGIHNENIFMENWFIEKKQSESKNIEFDKEIDRSLKIYNDTLSAFLKLHEEKNFFITSLKTNKQNTIDFIGRFKMCQYSISQIFLTFDTYNSNIKFKNNINTILRDGEDYDLNYDIYKSTTEMDSKTIDRNIYAITHQSMKIYIDFLKEMNKRLEIMSKSEINNNDKEIIETCDKNLDSFSNILNKNTSKLSIDIDNYLNTVKFVMNTKKEVNDFGYNDSVSVSKQALETDKLIYVMFVSYLISIIITNNISDI